MCVENFEVAHGAAGIAELLARLARIAPPEEMPIATVKGVIKGVIVLPDYALHSAGLMWYKS